MSRSTSTVLSLIASLAVLLLPASSALAGDSSPALSAVPVESLSGTETGLPLPGIGPDEAILPVQGPFSAPVSRKIVLLPVETGGSLPLDLTSPEGMTRWDLTGVVTRDPVTRTIERSDGHATMLDQGGAEITLTSAGPLAYDDPTGGDAAIRWMFPDRDTDTMRPSARTRLEVLERRGDDPARGPDDLVIDIETIGAGWVQLPSGPREVALQRVLVLRRPDGAAGYEPDSLIHRWVDPLAGPVAEIRGTASADGRDRIEVTGAWVLDSVLVGQALAKLYVPEVFGTIYGSIQYGWDRGSGTTISMLTPDAYANIGALIAANSWDFSGNTSGAESASTTVPVNSAETCNFNSCGYTVAGGQLQRQDKNFDIPASLVKINTVEQREDRPGDVTIWLRAGSTKEGQAGSGGLGTGESRFCYFGGGRKEVPLWRFPHQDATGWFMQPGDSWSSAAFTCEQDVNIDVCSGGGLFTAFYIKGCTGSAGVHTGTQSGEVLKSGVVTLPSGHTFNALVARTVADFCVYLTSLCGSNVDEARTVVYLWQVPHLGTVVRLMSPQTVSNVTTFTTLEETDIKFGLFPPLTIQTDTVTDNSIQVSWNPGNDTHRITGYKVYWDTDSGGATSYAFNSQNNPGQVAFAGTSATISGLTPGTNYFVTVTSLSTFTDPSSNITTTYESLVYPTQVFGDPSSVYPIEVQAMTTGGTCLPTAEVTGLMIGRSGTDCVLTWNPVSDPCLTGYRVLGADTPDMPGNFTTVADTGIGTSWTGPATQQFYLVIAKGTGGNGPLGHFSQ